MHAWHTRTHTHTHTCTYIYRDKPLTTLEVGFPAPWPAFVSIRIINGFVCNAWYILSNTVYGFWGFFTQYTCHSWPVWPRPSWDGVAVPCTWTNAMGQPCHHGLLSIATWPDIAGSREEQKYYGLESTCIIIYNQSSWWNNNKLVTSTYLYIHPKPSSLSGLPKSVTLEAVRDINYWANSNTHLWSVCANTQ